MLAAHCGRQGGTPLQHLVKWCSSSGGGNWRGWTSPLKTILQIDRLQIGIENVGQESVLFRLALQDYVVEEEIAEPQRIGIAPLNTHLPAGHQVAQISWSGYKRSASDELYHASWNEQVQGSTDIRLPFAATILEANLDVLKDPSRLLLPDTVTWILRARASKYELRRYF
mmetsp:Transcript_17061/g.44690  ORF Transcript_17061/g.44690 Transcript_17061/m.44690 type:complete len:170 (+) Transcript_17061:51-560(+)